MKIAFATKDNMTVDDHFGWCKAFAVYEVTPAGFKFIETRDVFEGGDEVDKIDKRIEAIRDCTIMYCAAIGPVAAARVVRQRIHPMKVSQPESIHEILNRFKETLQKPPIWLRKILEKEL